MAKKINKPLVSVVMPAYNSGKYITDSIESILNQTYKNIELIIINDCSTDETLSIINSFVKKDSRIKCIDNEVNKKISESLNSGIRLAKGKYIARMDSDDIAMPDRLARQVDYMERHADVVLSGGSIYVCSHDMKIINMRRYNIEDDNIRAKIFRYNQFCHPATIFLTEAVRKAGLYNKVLYDAEDYDLYFRLGQFGKFGNLTDPLLKYRTSSSSVSAVRAHRQELLTIFIRIKAVAEYGYTMKFADWAYTIAQFISAYIVPSRFKFWIFNAIRSMGNATEK